MRGKVWAKRDGKRGEKRSEVGKKRVHEKMRVKKRVRGIKGR